MEFSTISPIKLDLVSRTCFSTLISVEWGTSPPFTDAQVTPNIPSASHTPCYRHFHILKFSPSLSSLLVIAKCSSEEYLMGEPENLFKVGKLYIHKNQKSEMKTITIILFSL